MIPAIQEVSSSDRGKIPPPPQKIKTATLVLVRPHAPTDATLTSCCRRSITHQGTGGLTSHTHVSQTKLTESDGKNEGGGRGSTLGDPPEVNLNRGFAAKKSRLFFPQPRLRIAGIVEMNKLAASLFSLDSCCSLFSVSLRTSCLFSVSGRVEEVVGCDLLCVYVFVRACAPPSVG